MRGSLSIQWNSSNFAIVPKEDKKDLKFPLSIIYMDSEIIDFEHCNL